MAPGGLEVHGQEATEVGDMEAEDMEAEATGAASDLLARVGATGALLTGAPPTGEAFPGATETDRGAP